MKIRNTIWVGIVAASLYSCYDDLGNYDYRDINEIEVKGIEKYYPKDVDDSLRIYPQIEGTLYNDTTKFTYEWEIANKIVSTGHNLEIVVNMVPGSKVCRYIVKDKETQVKKYYQFTLNVSSSTAGDLIVMLNKYQGKAEMSYLRLDKPSNFAINYFEERFGQELGLNPKQLHIQYTETPKIVNYPFTNQYGRVMVLTDDQIRLIDKSTMMPDTIIPYLEGSAYTGLSSYPPADISGYKPEFMLEGFYIWRKDPYGSRRQQATHFIQISGGTVYSARLSNYLAVGFTYKAQSAYANGYLSDYCFWDDMTPQTGTLQEASYSLGNLIVFDQVHGRFATASAYGGVKSTDTKYLKAFPGYSLFYGCATNIANNTCVAVLKNGDNFRMLLINTGKDDENKNTVHKLVADVNCTGIINSSTRFYTMNNNEYIFFVTGDKIYKYNLLNLTGGNAPNESNLVAKLSDFGYDANATITALCVSRSERTMLLGISRYGTDTEAVGDEAKGDLLYFNLNAPAVEITYVPEKSHKGVAGIPVDVKIKYQTHLRDGLEPTTGQLIDNI